MTVIIEKIQVSPMQMMATGGGVPPEQFLKALETHSDLGAVVLFLGFPQLTDSELEVLKKSGVKTVVALCASSGRPPTHRAAGDQSGHRTPFRLSSTRCPGTSDLARALRPGVHDHRACCGCPVALNPAIMTSFDETSDHA